MSTDGVHELLSGKKSYPQLCCRGRDPDRIELCGRGRDTDSYKPLWQLGRDTGRLPALWQRASYWLSRTLWWKR